MEGIRSLDSTVMWTVLSTLDYKDIGHFVESFKSALSVIPESHAWKKLRWLYLSTDSFAMGQRSPTFLTEMAVAADKEKDFPMDVLRSVVPDGMAMSCHRIVLETSISIIRHCNRDPRSLNEALIIAECRNPKREINRCLNETFFRTAIEDGDAEAVKWTFIKGMWFLPFYAAAGDFRMFSLVYSSLENYMLYDDYAGFIEYSMMGAFGSSTWGGAIDYMHELFVKYAAIGMVIGKHVRLPGRWDEIEQYLSDMARYIHMS